MRRLQVECQPGSRRLLERPELAGEPDRAERLGCFRGCPPAPSRIEAILVPQLRQRPRLIERERHAARQRLLRAPAVEMLFGTEEEHCRSRVADVLPPAPRRQREMDQTA